MRKFFFPAYSFVAYLVGVGSLLWLMAFLGNVALPVTVNAPLSALSVTQAVALDVVLLLAFGLHHSAFAREGIKRRLARFHAEGLIRSTYFLVAGILLFALCLLWQPLPGFVWRVELDAARVALHALYIFGWVVMFTSAFLIDHFELAGLRQAWFAASKREAPEAAFRTPFLYRLVRHPMQTGMLILHWSTPDMTSGRLLFAGAMTAYILIGLYFEERDLVRTFGDRYRLYRDTVPKLLPLPRRG